VSSSERRRERREQRARELARKREQQAQPFSANDTPPLKQAETEATSAPAEPVRALAGWLTHWVWFDKSQLVAWLFRLFTVLSVFYLVYDRIYDTSLTASIVASDPNDAFKYPFSINNTSRIFSISNIQWNCILISIKSERLSMDRSLIGFGTKLSIPPGQNLNIGCNPYSIMHFEGSPKITTAVIQILLLYDVDILRIIHWHRVPAPTLFTWFGDASNPQWVRGDYAR